RELPFESLPACFSTNLSIEENATAWYCVRASGADVSRQVAVTGAFYFFEKQFRPPVPVPARIHVRILDAVSGRPLSGTLTEVAFHGTMARKGKQHTLNHGERHLTIPATVRLMAEAKGYSPQTLSPFLDNPEMVRTVTIL